jgi:uncharacterized NAD-dependent epimerase/dehydratase family protein
MMLELPYPYLVFLGDTREPLFAKTAFGLADWARERCIGEWSCGDTHVTTGLPRVSPRQARENGARSLVIGVANYGGVIQENWIPTLLEALDAGLDLIGGMHARLQDIEPLRTAAARLGRRLIDVRIPPANIPVASGRKRSGKRLLTVGTDCALGKKYSALALTRAFRGRGIEADFRATGQTGILISGRGIPMDAVVSDFEAGAAEMLSPDSPPQHWDVIEGQGSLFHPSYAAVSLGLLHGSQPDVLVVCHQAGRTHILGKSDYLLPSLEEAIDLNLRLGSRTNPDIRCAGVSLNTSRLDDGAARDLMAIHSQRLGMPVADPIRGGAEFERLVDACLA